jgi:hypothetical protein
MSLTGGKRKVNKSLKAWVAFVKKVQREEKLSYKDAIHRAKQRKDKGEKWMSGGAGPNGTPTTSTATASDDGDMNNGDMGDDGMSTPPSFGGRRRSRTARRSRGRGRARGRARTARRSRGRGRH